MASTGPSHPSFANRPYSSTHGKLPERTAAGFAQTHTGSGNNARIERERQDRDRGGREAQSSAQGGSGAQNPLSSITDEQREEINEAFGLFDLDKDQRIDYHEFKVALKALGFDLPKSEILSLLTSNGISKDAPIGPPARNAKPQNQNIPVGKLILTLQAFQSIAATLISNRDPKEEILRAFALFDTEDKGIISIDDLRRVARELGEALEEDELTAMIEEFDLEGRGGVGKDEFIGICMG